MFQKTAAAFFCLFLILPCFISSAYASPVSSGAESIALMEKETGTLLYAENEHKPLEPASVTKIMTLLLTMEAIDDGRLHYDDLLSASEHAASMGGSQVYIESGEQMRVDELLKAVCLASGNDASVMLAEGIAGSEEAFVSRMNERAVELGMSDTHFCNCTGLPAEGHVTSAYDIALMSRELILHHPDIRNYTTLWMDTLRNGTFQLANTNKLIRYYDGATGLKTGSTDNAGYCLSATAERDGMELIATVLNAPTSAERFETAKNLLSFGFANYTLVDVYPDKALPTIPVTMGKKDVVQPIFASRDKVLMEKLKVSEVEKEIELSEQVAAPISEGQTLGCLTVTSGGEVLAEIPLVAGESVERLSYWDVVCSLLHCAVFMP